MARTTAQTCTRYTIAVRGDSDEAKANALREAIDRIESGNTSGADSCDESAFYFEASDDVKRGDWPA